MRVVRIEIFERPLKKSLASTRQNTFLMIALFIIDMIDQKRDYTYFKISCQKQVVDLYLFK